MNEEVLKEEQAENLSVILGYDAINEDLNQGKMRNYLEQSVG